MVSEVGPYLQGKYGNGAREIFEKICALLILREHNLAKNKRKIAIPDVRETVNYLDLPDEGTFYHVALRQGDGGLDIIIETKDDWIVFQCKFLYKSDLTNYSSEIQDSFNTALKTAAENNKTIKKWVLCTTQDLDNKERIETWDKFKKANITKVNEFDIITNTHILEMLTRSKDISKIYFESSDSSDKKNIEDVINRVRSENIIKIVKDATGGQNPSCFSLSPADMKCFKQFVDDESDETNLRSFKDSKAEQTYQEFINVCQKLRDHLSNYDQKDWLDNEKEDQTYYLGVNLNQLLRGPEKHWNPKEYSRLRTLSEKYGNEIENNFKDLQLLVAKL